MSKINVSLKVIALFMIAILVSKIPELYPNFFGDWFCQGKWIIDRNEYGFYKYTGCDYGNDSSHNPEWHWGYQHWLFFLMGLSLFAIQIKNIIEQLKTTKK